MQWLAVYEITGNYLGILQTQLHDFCRLENEVKFFHELLCMV